MDKGPGTGSGQTEAALIHRDAINIVHLKHGTTVCVDIVRLEE